MNLLRTTIIFLITILSLIIQYAYAACVSEYPNGIIIQSNVTSNIANYNKYETSDYINVGGIQVVSNENLQFGTVFSGCNGISRNVKAKISLSEANRIPSTNIYKLDTNSPFAIKLEVGDTPVSSTLYEINNIGKALLGANGWSGPTSGVRLRFTIYLLDDFRADNLIKDIHELEIGHIYLVSDANSDTPIAGTGSVPIKLTANLKTNEHTCMLSNQSPLTIALDNVSLNQLRTVGEDSTLAPKTLSLTINCPYLRNGGSREVKAYITDSNDPYNATSILKNKQGLGFATGVGIRLRDKDNTIINLDPNESLSSKWTFGYLMTTPSVIHTIRANYVRTDNHITAGDVEVKALLNIVYD